MSSDYKLLIVKGYIISVFYKFNLAFLRLMIRTLYIIRHSQAEESGFGKKDIERELTAEGFRQATKLGQFIKEKNIKIDFVLLSASSRTQQTFERINEQLMIDAEDVLVDEDIYEGSVRTLLRAVNSMDAEIKHALLIGHNPSVSYLSEYLSGAEIGNMSPASVVEINFELSTWSLVSEKTGNFVSMTNF